MIRLKLYICLSIKNLSDDVTTHVEMITNNGCSLEIFSGSVLQFENNHPLPDFVTDILVNVAACFQVRVFNRCPWRRKFNQTSLLFSGGANPSENYGYGNCERLVGKSFSKVIKRFRGEFIITSMDIHVFPPTGYKKDEVFRVSVKQFATPKDGVFFINSIRVTTYSKFAPCADKSVDIKLCACTKHQTSDLTKKGVLFENGVPRKMFGSETIVKDLDSNCLLFLRRDYRTFSFVLEVANVCTNTTYKFTMTGSTDQRVFTNTLPISLELPPKTFHFLTSVSKYVVKVDSDLNLKASIHVKNGESNTFHFLRTARVL